MAQPETVKPFDEEKEPEVEKKTWKNFFRDSYAKYRDNNGEQKLTPKQIMSKIASDWKEIPDEQKQRTDAEGSKRKRQRPDVEKDNSAADDAVTTATTDSDAESERKTRRPVFQSRLYAQQTMEAFEGKHNKLSIYNTAGKLMQKQGEGLKREKLTLHKTRQNRAEMLRQVRIADLRIQRGEITDLYDALETGFKIVSNFFELSE